MGGDIPQVDAKQGKSIPETAILAGESTQYPRKNGQIRMGMIT
jgi:hypothetical protein